MAAPIESEVPYHLAITLETSDAGIVTMKVFLKQGTGAINTKQDEDLVSQDSFSVITDNADKVLYDGAISIGANSRTSRLGLFWILRHSGFSSQRLLCSRTCLARNDPQIRWQKVPGHQEKRRTGLRRGPGSVIES